MSADFLARVAKLPYHPTATNPLGQRHAVLERSAILHFDAGMPLAEADALAWELEVIGKQTRLGGVE